jgi:glycine cleavage system H protein
VSHVPSDLHYTRTHEWIRQLPDGNVEIGITEHAQAALGELVFVETPAAGRALALGEAFAVVESVKAASDVYSPVAGEVVAGNTELGSAPEKVNAEPYGSGWLMRLRPAAGHEPPRLLSADEYQKFLETEG